MKEEEVNAAVKRLNIMKKGIRINMEKEPDRFLNEEREWTLIDDEQDRLDLVRYFNYTNLLEEEKKDIGIVNAIVGIAWLEVTVTGESNHSGTVPMDRRKDAGIGAYEMILSPEPAAVR